jgi:hypothetical protein
LDDLVVSQFAPFLGKDAAMSCFDLRALRWSIPFVFGVLVLTVAVASAAPPWQTLAPFKRIEADPNNAYPVVENNGPWMIVAYTFRGENADTQAQKLVHELRNKHKLPAYTFKKRYDFTGVEQGKGFNRNGGPKMMKYISGDIHDEVAVLVGDFDRVDDARATRTLQKIKYLQPESIRGHQAATANEPLNLLKETFRSISSTKEDRPKGPMSHAFVGTNPLLPKEYFVSSGVDRIVLEMNDGVPHSLLDCPGKYTVKIATFNGVSLVDAKRIKDIESGKSKKFGSRLAEAAENAHKLTEALRRQGVDAYEFHDRDKSVVCVGSFKRIGVEHPDGRLEMDPQVRQTIERFTAPPEVLSQARASAQGLDGTQVAGAVFADASAIRQNAQPKPLMYDGVPLDVEPQPFEVPKRSISAAYQRSMRSTF